MSDDPARSVVNNQFRVHGYEDIFVCEARDFPSPVQLNPMATVMATAGYAVEKIIRNSDPAGRRTHPVSKARTLETPAE